jgi:hypothetical protein
MFNLEISISEWRSNMVFVGVMNPDIVDELESHLREDWVRRVELGESEEQAFNNAVQIIGGASSIKDEFAKVGDKKWAWLKRFNEFVTGAFNPVPSLNTFTPAARWTLELARWEAPRLNHGFVGTEHVLLGFLALEDGVVPSVLRNLGVDRQSVQKEVENWVSGFPFSESRGRPSFTPRVAKSLRFAAIEAKACKGAFVGVEHIFLGLLREGEGVAERVLRDFGLTPETTREQIMRETGQNRGSN